MACIFLGLLLSLRFLLLPSFLHSSRFCYLRLLFPSYALYCPLRYSSANHNGTSRVTSCISCSFFPSLR